MEVRAHLEEFDRLLNTLLPAIVQDAATSEGGRVYRAVMSRVEMPCCARPSSFRRAISSRPPGCSGSIATRSASVSACSASCPRPAQMGTG